MTQLVELQQHLGAYQERKATVVALCVDSVSRNRAVATRHHLDFPILSDPALTVTRAFGVEDAENGVAWPAVFVLGPDGRVRWRSLSDDYTKRPSSTDLLAAIDRPMD